VLSKASSNLTDRLAISELNKSIETAVRKLGGWCEMAASLRGRESGSRGTSSVGSRYQTAQ
jgi:hypothetical protein